MITALKYSGSNLFKRARSFRASVCARIREGQDEPAQARGAVNRDATDLISCYRHIGNPTRFFCTLLNLDELLTTLGQFHSSG